MVKILCIEHATIPEMKNFSCAVLARSAFKKVGIVEMYAATKS